MKISNIISKDIDSCIIHAPKIVDRCGKLKVLYEVEEIQFLVCISMVKFGLIHFQKFRIAPEF